MAVTWTALLETLERMVEGRAGGIAVAGEALHQLPVERGAGIRQPDQFAEVLQDDRRLGACHGHGSRQGTWVLLPAIETSGGAAHMPIWGNLLRRERPP